MRLHIRRAMLANTFFGRMRQNKWQVAGSQSKYCRFDSPIQGHKKRCLDSTHANPKQSDSLLVEFLPCLNPIENLLVAADVLSKPCIDCISSWRHFTDL